MEWWILLAVYIIATGILLAIPKNKIRPAVVAFLFTQIITFLLGLVAVEFGLLEYPVRLFPSINRASFTFEYYAFPAVCALFYVHYPRDRSILFRFIYTIGLSSVLTLVEVIIERYTELIKYTHWEWHTSLITISLSLFTVLLFCDWFFKK
jgi:hypothetical protein